MPGLPSSKTYQLWGRIGSHVVSSLEV